jgi:hypothetical protein
MSGARVRNVGLAVCTLAVAAVAAGCRSSGKPSLPPDPSEAELVERLGDSAADARDRSPGPSTRVDRMIDKARIQGASGAATGSAGGASGRPAGDEPQRSAPVPSSAAKTPPAPSVDSRHGPLPSYRDAATAYNRRVESMTRVFARANIRLSYFDENGELKTEDPEGRLQVVRPDKLSLSLGKAGQIMLWFGCNSEKYWWFDLTEKDNRILAFGRHAKYTESIGKRIGLPIRPLDLIRVLAIEPLDVNYPGATQWTMDGSQLGLTSAIGSRGFQRLWVDPTTYLPISIEVYDAQRRPVLTAQHSGQEPFELANGAGRPPITSRITVDHIESKTQARITLSGAKDTGVSEKAFILDELLERYPVDRQIDVDAPRRSAAVPGTGPAPGAGSP